MPLSDSLSTFFKNTDPVTLDNCDKEPIHLRGITMALEAMDEEKFDENIVKQTHGIAQRSAKRLTDLTAALLDLSVISDQKYDFETINLNDIARSATELLISTISESSATIDSDKLPTIIANSNLITRLFLNLFSNSIKYAHPDRTPEIQIRYISSNRDYAVFHVSDNGLGIDKDNAQSIFEPLQRLHSAEQIEGTGLGLTICKKAVDIHGGSIKLDTSYTEGTRFRISLPIER